MSTLAQVERFVGMLERHPEMVWTGQRMMKRFMDAVKEDTQKVSVTE